MLMVSASDVRSSFQSGFLERQAPRDFNALSVLGRVPFLFPSCDDAVEHPGCRLASTVRPGVLNEGQGDMLASNDLVEVDIEGALPLLVSLLFCRTSPLKRSDYLMFRAGQRAETCSVGQPVSNLHLHLTSPMHQRLR